MGKEAIVTPAQQSPNSKSTVISINNSTKVSPSASNTSAIKVSSSGVVVTVDLS